MLELSAAHCIRAPAVVDSIAGLLGNTPTVRLDRLTASHGLAAAVFMKLEYFNPGGSHKARIALAMVMDAEKRGVLTRGSGQTIVEGTGGNTGIGLAIAANLLGYRLVLAVPDNYSKDKIKLLRAYGADVRLSDSRLGRDSHFRLAQELLECNPGWFMPDQLTNPINVQAHYESTGREIVAAFRHAPIDVLVAGAGSGGHITGIGRVLKEVWPNVAICLVQPERCDFRANVFSSHRIQATAIGRVPKNLDLGIVDHFVDVFDEEALASVRLLMQYEGIGVGLSSGANIAGCLKMAATSEPGTRILCMAYDHVSDYLDAI
ncbi:PLP-dependent cysteine synthase family protein [Rhodopseudomonas palustris]|uniref:Cysteine synthase n=1 Tax=Rhodopseudomonas palustris TaxID=1076 RepID=A0A418VP31_RHOPL|nr:cysteine synthase family protein [Rhodopseudomonas palustris]RJF77967.1 cysteine synthase family protein [Rhodopseudomonas palustris]